MGATHRVVGSSERHGSESLAVDARARRDRLLREKERRRHPYPKAARVAQREAYNVFKRQSGKQQESERVRAGLQVGGSVVTYSPPQEKACSSAEISEVAEACVTMLEVQGKAVAETLAEISVAAGGWVGVEDVQKISEAAHALICANR